MKQIKRMLVLIVALSLISMLFSACGQNSSTQQAVSSGGDEPSEKTASEEQSGEAGGATGEVRYIRLADHPRKEAIDVAVANNPGLTVDEESVPFDNLDSKINMAHASGQDYDLIQVNNSSIKQFYATGVLEPLDGYLSRGGLDSVLEKNYSPSLLEIGKVNGSYYAISYAPDCRLLAYNKKILDKAGLEPPKDQDDVLGIAKAIAKDGLYIFARSMDTPLAPAYIEGCFFLANGAKICTEADGKVKANTNTPEMIKSVEFWKSLVPYMPKDPNMSGEQVAQYFIQGKTVFHIYGPWDISGKIGETLKYGEDYGLMLAPGDKKNGSTAGGWFIGIGAGGKNKDGAWEIIKASMEPEIVTKICNGLPPDKRCYEMAPFNGQIYKPFMEGLSAAEPPFPITPSFNKINDIFFEYFNRVLIGGEDTAAAMETCNTEIQKVLDEE